MLWLFDSRNRIGGMRLLYKLPYTYDGKKQAWNIVLDIEVPDEIEDYAFLRDDEGYDDLNEACEVFNDYWGCYGWWLQGTEPDAEIPNDVRLAAF